MVLRIKRDILCSPLAPCWSCCPAPPPAHLWPSYSLAWPGGLGHVDMSDYKVASQCPPGGSLAPLTLTWPPAAHLLSWRELS